MNGMTDKIESLNQTLVEVRGHNEQMEIENFSMKRQSTDQTALIKSLED